MRLFEKLIVKSLQAFWRQSRGLTLGVQAIVRDEAGRVLLVRETTEAAWCLPATGVRSDEAAPAAVVRMLGDLAGIETAPPLDLRSVEHGGAAAPNQHLAVYALALGRAHVSDPRRHAGTTAFFTLSDLPASLGDAERRRVTEIVSDATR